MKNVIRSALLAATLVLLASSWIACDGMEDDSTGTLSGVVREEGTETPLADVVVELNSVETATDQDGRFEYRDVPVGVRTLRVSTAGFGTYTEQIVVQAGGNSHDVSLMRRTYYELDSDYGSYGLYLPSGISTYRGVIFLGPPSGMDVRGFASGIPISPNPVPGLNEFVAAERQRSLLLAQKHGLALIGAEITRLDREATADVLTVLERFAEESGHPELAQAPLLMMGFSWGGCFAYEFTRWNSSRVVGFMTQKGACHSAGTEPQASPVPGYLFIGSLDLPHTAENITRAFETNRAIGALWALAIEPGAGHTAVRDQDLLFNWMDAVLEARLPETVTPGEPVTLRALDETSGWLGDQESFAIADYAGYEGDPLQASWLPTMQAALDWKAFVTSDPGGGD